MKYEMPIITVEVLTTADVLAASMPVLGQGSMDDSAIHWD